MPPLSQGEAIFYPALLAIFFIFILNFFKLKLKFIGSNSKIAITLDYPLIDRNQSGLNNHALL
jgi:hypothetical protein